MPPSFRPANVYDAPLLYRWRQEREQGSWWKGTPVTYEQHQEWLEQRLDNPLVRVLIWEDDGEPVGMIRIDSNGEIAFHGGSPGMLEAAAAYACEYGGRLKATVDEDDVGTTAILKAAGFAEYATRFLALKPTKGQP